MPRRAPLSFHATAATLTAVAFAIVFSPAVIEGQQRTLAPVGAYVRVSASARPDWTEGIVERVDSTRLVVRATDMSADTIPLADVRAIQMRRVRHAVPRAVAGTLLGGLAGGAIGTGIGCSGTRGGSEYQAMGCAVGGFFGMIGGAVIGGVAGGLSGRDQWEYLPLPGR